MGTIRICQSRSLKESGRGWIRLPCGFHRDGPVAMLDWSVPFSMFRSYAHWIDAWERRLSARSADRTIRPFDWGLEWLGEPGAEGDAPACLRDYVRRAVACSGQFFSCQTPADFVLRDGRLSFTSPLPSFHPENNRVYADLFPAARDRGRAVLVLPQWNADATGHVALCGMLNRFGLTALRMSMAYHDRRMPSELRRADYHVSSNVGRTIHACRQSVLDARCCLDWLESQGCRRLGILGTSLGSCIAFIVAAHDARLLAGVYNHVSMYFGDVVWTGLATRHVREGFGQALTQEELREYWRVISPAAYVDRMAGRETKNMLIWARYDTTFLPEYSRQFVASMLATDCPTQAVSLPCGHYTTGEFPFNLMDAFLMCRFLSRNL